LLCITDQNLSKVIDPLKRERCPYGKFCYRKNPAHRQEAIHPGDPDWDNKENDTENKKPECPFGIDCYRKNPDHINQYSHTQKRSKTKQRTSKRKRRFHKIFEMNYFLGSDDDDDDDDGLPNEYDYNDSFINDENLDDSTRIDRAGK
jgi:aprataxin and PNK-like factor